MPAAAHAQTLAGTPRRPVHAVRHGQALRWIGPALVLCGTQVQAESIRCESLGTCVGGVECYPNDLVLDVRIADDGSARWAWTVENPVWLEAEGQLKDTMRVWTDASRDLEVYTLAILDNGEGSLQTLSNLGPVVYAAVDGLICAVKD
jgi:hypothetical protein